MQLSQMAMSAFRITGIIWFEEVDTAGLDLRSVASIAIATAAAQKCHLELAP